MLSELDVRVRHAVYRTFAGGGIPLSATLAHTLNLPLDDIRHAYTRLHEGHALVLDPQTREVRMALPFSAITTPHRVISGDRSWFANCAWDAFAIPPMMQCDARVESACADCDTPMTYHIEHGDLRDAHGVVHFAVPAARWWEDIGFT